EAVLILAPKGKPEKPKNVTRTVLRMTFLGANPNTRVAGQEELPGKANYFIGSDPVKWRTNVPMYGKTRYQEIYPGIDLVLYGNQRQLEYDFVVHAGADPKAIALDVQGADKLEVDAQGDLVLHTGAGVVRQLKPVIYQEVDGARREIAGGYVLKSARRVGFHVAAYDGAKPLVIDPVLVYSSYLGGSGGNEGPTGIAVDTAGNAYVTGATGSTNFPTTPGAFQTTVTASGSVYVTKLDPSGAPVYSTFLGGSGGDDASGFAVDAAGNAYVTGGTNSTDFPTTPGAFQPALAGPQDIFVTKLNPVGAPVYSTYLGGSATEGGAHIAVDVSGNAYVTGTTGSTDFPTTPGAFQPTFGGNTFGGAIDGFVTKLGPAGAPVYSTFLGGSGVEGALGIAVDGAGNAYVAGFTQSTNFPTTPGAFQPTFGGSDDAFVTKITVNTPSGSNVTVSAGNGVTVTFTAV